MFYLYNINILSTLVVRRHMILFSHQRLSFEYIMILFYYVIFWQTIAMKNNKPIMHIAKHEASETYQWL